MLSYRFPSENLINYLNAQEYRTGNEDFKYTLLCSVLGERGGISGAIPLTCLVK